MAMEGSILQTSLSGLIASKNASGSSNQSAFPSPLLQTLQQTWGVAAGKNPGTFRASFDTAEIWSAAFQPLPFIDAVTREAQSRMESFVRGVRTYQSHPFRRTLTPPPVVWKRGVATVLDYGGPEDGPPALFVPSLINRAYILDLAEDRSLMRAAAQAGLRGFLLDWGDPGEAERGFTVEDYLAGVLIPALEEVKARTGQTPRLIGYCLGGTLTVAAPVLRPDLVSGLVLLAAPWDFHNGSEASRVLLTVSQAGIEGMLKTEGVAPVDLLQALFASLDPTLVGRKFRNFAGLDPASEPARRFVELEDWLNDGVPLAAPVAREVFFQWYGTNDPVEGRWKVGETVIDPARIACPTLVFIPSQDRIVPPGSAERLAQTIPKAETRTVELGHIGMVSGGSAPKRVYAPVLEWLKNPPTR
jgi:polyhydroxyalkanoate synthase